MGQKWTCLKLADDLSANLVSDVETDGLLGHDEVSAIVAHTAHHTPVPRTQFGNLRKVLRM